MQCTGDISLVELTQLFTPALEQAMRPVAFEGAPFELAPCDSLVEALTLHDQISH